MARLEKFVRALTQHIQSCGENEEAILKNGVPLLTELVQVDDWLHPSCAVPNDERYQQYLLYLDPQSRFSVVSFVWGPGQKTPIHDHTTWGMVGMLRGRETSQRFWFTDEQEFRAGAIDELVVGAVDTVSPRLGDIHKVSNSLADEVSISIHVYGKDIGTVERHVYDEHGNRSAFVSGYANAGSQHVWDQDSDSFTGF
mmetsp:Transcript_51882/g.121642  ORF Transcript_51882/g.121642 Transcript_51882/m.121642 type:complete len:198 (-) Transcript_51882:18-611(-)|eukprot:CAMPEP_0175903420 /NCGR_PEP_ID=MMETSP0108-20121206/3927_1 /TAXON_ID=195067 ORGANISM="Goniomonas pacifica, Strain CCMP1869" /NCGR_SAMPLE_ID=MMETSP0108 /ASSEMBLY_ACC=CAM_ASM_000204 /LENGTH=197 /DNA_ID=CAMNT_0017225151 /DNA_START=15 /DNA_END=608 /DNA_ORIENTATION=-